jgi:hypothetical protein
MAMTRCSHLLDAIFGMLDFAGESTEGLSMLSGYQGSVLEKPSRRPVPGRY